MQQAISTQHLHLGSNNSYAKRLSVKTNSIAKFFSWCEGQDSNKFMWLGIAVMGSIGAVLPVTLSAIAFIGGNNFALWIIALSFNVPVLIVNLAAQPAKITLPALFLSWIVNALIILYCVIGFFIM